MLQVDVNLAQLDLAIYRFARDLGLSLPVVVKATARQLNAEMIRVTPPRSLAQGRAAVARDINRAILGLDPEKLVNPRFRDLVKTYQVDAVRAILRHTESGRLANYQLVRFTPVIHTSARDSRGRVRSTKLRFTADYREHQSYVKQVQGRVGSTKAWWGPSARKVGNSIPGWIGRHDVPGVAVVDNLDDSKHPRIVMINQGKGISAVSAAIISAAIRRRTVAMTRDVEQVLAGRASRYFK